MQQLASNTHFALQILIIINSEACMHLFSHTAHVLPHMQSVQSILPFHTQGFYIHLFVFPVRVLPLVKPLLIPLVHYLEKVTHSRL